MYPLASKRQIGGLGQAGGGAGGISLPYTFDPSALSDGALPSPWVGNTFAVSSGVIVNTPTLGIELLTDGGLEATYTAGLCDSLTYKAGTPTVSESADAQAGSKAQSFTGVADNDELSFPLTSISQGIWYVFSGYGKRTAGTSGRTVMRLYQASSTPAVSSMALGYNDETYIKRTAVKRAVNANQMRPTTHKATAASATDTILGDSYSLKAAVAESLFAIIDTRTADMVVKARNNWDGRNGLSGVVAKCNQDKTSFLIAYYWLQSSVPLAYCVLEKCVSGIYTQLIATWSNSGGVGNGGMPTASQDLEIRTSGTTVQLFHNGAQVGTDQTVSDAEITGNTYAGFFETGGNSANRFFVSAN